METVIENLIREMEQMPVVDGHQHLPGEEELLAGSADVFTRIYGDCPITNAVTAGMTFDRARLRDTSIPLDERWREFSPFLDAIRETGYARAAQIAARDLYGIEEINDDTYELLSRRLQEANRPGLYRSILQERCRIERILNQGTWRTGREGYAPGVCRYFMSWPGFNENGLRQRHEAMLARHGGPFAGAEDWVRFLMQTIRDDGYVGLKLSAAHPAAECVSAQEAESLYRKYLAAVLDAAECRQLGEWLVRRSIEQAPDHRLVVAVHCGIHSRCGRDMTDCHPAKLIPTVIQCPRTTFDLYHGGIPWVREIAVMANQYPNVHLNLCWCHQISPYMTEQMLNEWMDLVPLNKIIGFGGDTGCPEETYGVLKLARENIARALAVRVVRGQLSESRAAAIARLWLYDNPKRIYGL